MISDAVEAWITADLHTRKDVPMTDATQPVPAHTMFTVLAALSELGEATATAVAEHAGLGYSTATAKLRAWEKTGQAERFRSDDNRAMWRLTDTGRTTTATPPSNQGAADTSPSGTAAATSDTGTPTDPLGTACVPERDGEPPVPAARDTDGASPALASTGGAPAPLDTVTSSSGGDEQPPSGEAGHDRQQSDAVPDDAEGEADADADAQGEAEADADADAQGEAEADADADAQGEAEADADAEGGSNPDPQGQAAGTGNNRRVKGSLRGAVLDILEAHPDRQYKTSELCKLIDAANAGSGARKASQGAVFNAAIKLVAAGALVQTVERPATFQLAPSDGGQ
ncbi:MarR family transcriptional regulator [Micromonospora sp. CA-248089]|uniref:MarR family transcriptional regulator n=1 Tax=Micromonospora sp. CA-248089 TaxID=3239960 RepID=UPI003D9147A7